MSATILQKPFVLGFHACFQNARMIWVYVILKIHTNNFIDDSNFLTFQFRQNSKMHKSIIGLFSLQTFN